MFGDNSKYLEALIENASIELAERLMFTFIFLTIVWVVRKIILRFVQKKATKERTKFVWNKYSYYVFFALSLIIIFDLWFKGFNNVLTLWTNCCWNSLRSQRANS